MDMKNDNNAFTGNFANSLQISGLIATKPLFKETKRTNGQISLSSSFILTQTFVGYQGKEYQKKFIINTRSPKVINELKKYTHQIYVTCLGKLDYLWDYDQHRPYYYPLVEEIIVENVCDEVLRENV